jgi:ubiquinone biosynthesis protein
MSYLIRLIRINWALWTYLFWLGLARPRWIRPDLSPARKFVEMLERLGTTFIKLGQGLSLYRDLLPDDYIEALQVLQDRVVPFSGELAVREIERSLGAPIQELFAEFDKQPLAAASFYHISFEDVEVEIKHEE